MTKGMFLNLKSATIGLLYFALTSSVFAQTNAVSEPKKTTSAPQVLIETTHGNLVIELYPDKAPKTVENFLRYVNEGFYDNTIFHRVIPNFMVQGGGFTADMQKKLTHEEIQNEADNGLRNRIGTVAMARTNDPHSATAQFFINVSQNTFLDFREKQGTAWGYTVFGNVVQGMKTVNQIRQVRTGFKDGFKDVPVEPILIVKARQIK